MASIQVFKKKKINRPPPAHTHTHTHTVLNDDVCGTGGGDGVCCFMEKKEENSKHKKNMEEQKSSIKVIKMDLLFNTISVKKRERERKEKNRINDWQ